MTLISESSQTYPDWDKLSPDPDIISSVKFKRKELLNIKTRLLDIVKNPQYWTTLCEYLTGNCSKQKFDGIMLTCLKSNEARVLHNEFIRAILFNAHFSPIPPPGIQLSNQHIPESQIKGKHQILKSENKNDTSSNLGHIPSIEQLSARIAHMTSMKIDNSALSLLFSELQHYLVTILKCCVEEKLRISDHSPHVISPSQISYVISKFPDLNIGDQSHIIPRSFLEP